MTKECREAEDYLLQHANDFSAVFMTVSNLMFVCEYRPDIFTDRTILALEKVLAGKIHSAQRQSFFLYRKTAEVLSMLMERTADEKMADLARQTLFSVLRHTRGPAFRGTCEAMGSLRLQPPIHEVSNNCKDTVSERNLRELLSEMGIPAGSKPAVKGRNLIYRMNSGRLLVLKTVSSRSRVPELSDEIFWMNYLRGRVCGHIPSRDLFRIPRPVSDTVLHLHGIPGSANDTGHFSESCFAAVFTTATEYFTYPNESTDHCPVAPEKLARIICENARLLGELASAGIIHTAPIPLFHNRIQRHRRADHGIYEWFRGGRLDRWLESCRYPNIGITGIRDFEHFTPAGKKPGNLYKQIGTHVLSLVLIAGSYFRNLSPDQVGRTSDGAPVDVCHLFDRKLFRAIIGDVYSKYFRGFTGIKDIPEIPVNLGELTDKLIDKMGVDRHMDEILRAADQQEMDRNQFEAFLLERGFRRSEIADFEQGASDISIETGPHLGDFNGRISVPELIDFTAASAAMCIVERFFCSRFPQKQARQPVSIKIQ